MKNPALFPLLIASAALLASGCSSGHVETERNERVRIPAGSRYAWTEPGAHEVPGENSPAAQNELARERIHRAIDGELARKGLQLTENAAGADFTVHYHLGVVRRQEWRGETYPGPFGPVPYMRCGRRGCRGVMRWGWYGPPEIYVHEVSYREGTLMFDLVEKSSGTIAFRAVGTKPLDRDDITEDGIRDAVHDLLEDLETQR